MAARNSGGEKRSRFITVSPQDFARPFFFLGIFRVTHDELLMRKRARDFSCIMGKLVDLETERIYGIALLT